MMFVSKNKPKSLIVSLIFLMFGALIFAYPNSIITLASTAFGIMLILYGIFLLIKNYYETKSNPNTSSAVLIIGILTIVLGILFIIMSGTIAKIVQYILGAWILFNGIERLLLAFEMGKNNDKFINQLIVAILLILAGLYTILKTNLTIQIIGIIMMIYAILEIFGYAFQSKDETFKEPTNETKLVIQDKKEEIKEATIVEEIKKEEPKKDDTPKEKKTPKTKTSKTSKKTTKKENKDSSKKEK